MDNKTVIPLNPISPIRVPDPRFVSRNLAHPFVTKTATFRVGDVVEAPYPNSRALVVDINHDLKMVKVHPMHYLDELDANPAFVEQNENELFVTSETSWILVSSITGFFLPPS